MSTINTGRVMPMKFDRGFNGDGILSSRSVISRILALSISRTGVSPNSGIR